MASAELSALHIAADADREGRAALAKQIRDGVIVDFEYKGAGRHPKCGPMFYGHSPAVRMQFVMDWFEHGTISEDEARLLLDEVTR